MSLFPQPDKVILAPRSSGTEEVWSAVYIRYLFDRPSGTFSVGKNDIILYQRSDGSSTFPNNTNGLLSLKVTDESSPNDFSFQERLFCKNNAGILFEVANVFLEKRPSHLYQKPDVILFARNYLSEKSKFDRGGIDLKSFVGELKITYNFFFRSLSPSPQGQKHTFEIISNREVFLSSFLPPNPTTIQSTTNDEKIPVMSKARIENQVFVSDKDGVLYDYDITIHKMGEKGRFLSEKRRSYTANVYDTDASSPNNFVSIPAYQAPVVSKHLKPDAIPQKVRELQTKDDSYFSSLKKEHFTSEDLILGTHRDPKSLNEVMTLSFEQNKSDLTVNYRESVSLLYWGSIQGHTAIHLLSSPRIFRK